MVRMKRLLFVIGAFGAGKTVLWRHSKQKRPEGVMFCYFDRIGIPSAKEMSRKFGSGEGWQRRMTIDWTRRIKREYLDDNIVFLDGQTRPLFVDEVCRIENVQDYRIILFCARTYSIVLRTLHQLRSSAALPLWVGICSLLVASGSAILQLRPLRPQRTTPPVDPQLRHSFEGTPR
jgi:hypothetical protein